VISIIEKFGNLEFLINESLLILTFVTSGKMEIIRISRFILFMERLFDTVDGLEGLQFNVIKVKRQLTIIHLCWEL